jgi:hypothetical protein
MTFRTLIDWHQRLLQIEVGCGGSSHTLFHPPKEGSLETRMKIVALRSSRGELEGRVEPSLYSEHPQSATFLLVDSCPPESLVLTELECFSQLLEDLSILP